MSRPAATVAALAALALPGCGSEGTEPTELAAVVPQDAELYAESVVRPEGAQREALESSLSLLLDTEDPGARITAEVNEEIAEEDSEITYEADIEPWLGERGAFFVSDFFPGGAGTDDESAVALVEVTDTDAAQRFIDKAAEEEEGSTTEATYEGIDYTLLEGDDSAGDDPNAAGLVGDHAVFGTEDAFQDVVDTEGGGPSLADDATFASTVEEPSQQAASLYVDAPAIVEAADAAGELSRSDREALDSVFAGIADEPVAATVEAASDGFGLEVSYGEAALPFLAATEESALLRELPEDAWFAAGFSDLGEGVRTLLGRAEDLGASGIERAEREFQRNYGLRLEDFYDPLGDGAVFASGRGVFGTGGGLVVEADSPKAAAKVVEGLRRQSLRSGENVRPLGGGAPDVQGFSLVIPDAPSALNFAASGERVVVAYGEDAAAAGLDPDETLTSSEEFSSASAALGEEFAVGLFLDFGPIAELLDLAAAADPSIEEAQRYLEAIDFVIAGSTSESGRDRQRIFLGLEERVSGPAT